MGTEHLDFITFCVGSLSDALHKSASQVYGALRSSGVLNDYIVPCYNTVDLYFAGVISKDEALGRLKYEKPNHQLCILNGLMLDRHLHFIKAERV